MKKFHVTACAALATVALAAGCGTVKAPAIGSRGASHTTAVTDGIAAPHGPVPAGFRAASVTFVSLREAFVLGTARCAHPPCTSIARTRNRGATWLSLPAPAVALGPPGIAHPAVWGIRFATPEHGFVFGNSLWETTDGGHHWSSAPYPGGSIISLEAVDGQVLAVTMHNQLHARWALWRRPLAGGAWTRLVGLAGAMSEIGTQAGVAAVIAGSSVLVTRDGGLTISKHRLPCTSGRLPEPTSVAVEAPDGLALLCTGQGFTGHTIKIVYVSSNLGATWLAAGHPSSLGDGGMIAASAPGHLTIATASAGSWLYSSANNGKTWRTVRFYPDGGQGWNDLGFTSTSDGVVIHGHPSVGNGVGQLLLTGNGGRTWKRVTF